MKIAMFFRENRTLILWLALVMIAGLVLVQPADARRYLSDGSGGSGTGEGDPLDANDFGTGGGGLTGDDVHNTFALIESGGGELVIAMPSADASLFVVLDFRGKIPVIRVINLTSRGVAVEETHAR